MRNLNKALEIINSAQDIVVAGHINPDGDCVGSLLALGLALKQTGKEVQLLLSDGVPEKFLFLPGASLVKRTGQGHPQLAIAVDCNTREMLGDLAFIFDKAGRVIEIDHHSLRRSFGDIKLVERKANSVGEIIYFLLAALKIKVDKTIAENILTSIIVETNSFRLPLTDPQVFNICAELVEKGVDYYKLSDRVYWSRSLSSVLIGGLALSRTRSLKDGRLLWTIIREKDYRDFKARQEDLDPLPNDMLSVDQAAAIVLFRESSPGVLRVSLRSKNRINVGTVALKHGGGGHNDSAGCFIQDDEKKIKRFLAEVVARIK